MLNFCQTTVPDTNHPKSQAIANPIRGAVPDEFREAAISVCILAAVVLCIFAPWLFYGKAFYWGDIGLFFLPLSHFLKSSLAQGSIPLWNPYLYSGAPFVGNPQVSVLYPSTLILPLVPAVTAIMISDVAHIFAAGVFFWFFARRGSFKLENCPAIYAASIYMLGGYVVAKAQFPNMLAALAYVPLILLQTELLVKTPTVRRSALFGLAIGLQLLAAHTQITVFTLYLTVPYGLLVYFSQVERANFFSVLLLAVAGGVIGGCFACGYWLPVAELIHSSARQALTLRVANRFYLPWRMIAGLAVPHLYGSPMRGDFHAHGNYWEVDNYIGPLPLVLAACCGVFALFKRLPGEINKSHLWFWLIVTVVSGWLAVGSQGRLFRYAFKVIPLLKEFHDPARLMLGATIGVALFAGIGLQSLCLLVTKQRRTVSSFIVILISAIVMGWHDRGIYPLKSTTSIENMGQTPIARFIVSREESAGGSRILMPDSRRTWQNFTTYKTYEQNDPNFLREWPDTLSPDMGMAYGVRDVEGYDPEYRRDSQELVDMADLPLNPSNPKDPKSIAPFPPNYARYLASIGVQYLITYRIMPISVYGFKPVLTSTWKRQHRQVTVYEDSFYSGRASLFGGWESVTKRSCAYDALCDRLLPNALPDAFNVPIVEWNKPSIKPENPSTAQGSATVRFLCDTPDDVKLSAPPVRSVSILVLADTMHPGWTATVDGQPAALLRANVAQRAIVLSSTAGHMRHIVEFRYHPADVQVGLYVSLLTLASFIFVFLGIVEKQR